MSRTSSDIPRAPIPVELPAWEQPGTGTRRGFQRAFLATVGVLALVTGVFLGLSYLKGPGLDSASLDVSAAVAAPAQLRLFADMPLDAVEASQITVEPATEFTVTASAETIAVQFANPLDYGTTYTVTVADVHSARVPQPGTLEYSFSTPQPDLYLLDRGEPDDVIYRTGLAEVDRETLYSASGIQDFAVVDFGLAVTRLAEGRSSTLELVEPARGVVEQVLLPESMAISELEASTTGELVGFLASSAEGGATQANFHSLYVLDLTAGARDLIPVAGVTGEQVRATGWRFLPGTTSLVVLTIDRDLLQIDMATGVVLPLGTADSFVGLSPDGGTAIVTDALGPIGVDLATGERTRITGSPLGDTRPFLGELITLPTGGHVAKAVLPDESGTRFATLLLKDDGEAAQVLYRTVDDGGSITAFDLSPNGQYVAVETVPSLAASVSDGYVLDARSTSTTTVIINVATGAQVRSMEGFGLAWVPPSD